MKLLTSLFLGLLFFQGAIAQNKDRVIPAVNLKKMDGSTFNTADLENNGKPMLIDFWATWCGPCKAELNAISDNYDEWKKEGFKVVAVSIDDARNMEKVAPYVNGRNWEFEILLDPNGDFKRAMNVNNVPHVFIVNGKKEVVWQQNASSPGDDEKIFELLGKVNRGESIQ